VRVARADHFGRTTPDALAREFPAGEWLLEQSRLLNVLAERPKPFLTGKFLLGLGMKPGREMGKLIAESFEMQLEGELADPEAAQEWARARLLE
jgi:tRNA nucleotidyltransferase (CCA-adding enzyme)